jgi:hypothetical protein
MCVVKKSGGEKLLVRLIGLEYAKVEVLTELDMDAIFSSESCRVFLDTPYLLGTSPDGVFLRGQYEFPFQIVVPEGVTPSMHTDARYCCTEGDCAVRYRVEARVFGSTLQHQLAIDVTGHANILKNPTVTYVPPVEKTVTNAIGASNGAIRFAMSTPSAIFLAGATVPLSFVIQNAAAVDIKAICFTFHEYVTWRSFLFSCSDHTILFTSKLESFSMPTQLVQYLSTPAPLVASTPRGKKGEVTDVNILGAMKNVLDEQKFVYHAAISADACPTMKGELITVRHELVVKIITPFGTSNPEFTFPITIYRNDNGEASRAAAMHQAAANNAPQYALNPLTANTTTTTPPTTGTAAKPVGLPADWAPVIATEAVFATPVYMDPMVGGPDPNLIREGSIILPSAPLIEDYSSAVATVDSTQVIQSLFQSLRQAYSATQVMTTWCNAHPDAVQAITSEHLRSFYPLLPQPLDQVQCTEIFIQSREKISGEHILSAIQSCAPVVKTSIILLLATKCIENHNTHQQFNGL